MECCLFLAFADLQGGAAAAPFLALLSFSTFYQLCPITVLGNLLLQVQVSCSPHFNALSIK